MHVVLRKQASELLDNDSLNNWQYGYCLHMEQHIITTIPVSYCLKVWYIISPHIIINLTCHFVCVVLLYRCDRSVFFMWLIGSYVDYLTLYEE